MAQAIGTVGTDGTLGAQRCPRAADPHREVENRVIVVAERAGGSQLIREIANPSFAPRLCVIGMPCHPAQPTSNIVVDDHGSTVPVERKPSRSGVWTDTGKSDQFGLGLRRGTSGFSYSTGGLVEERPAPVEANDVGELPSGLWSGSDQRRGRREPRTELHERPLGLQRFCALKERLSHEGQPWI